MSNTSSLLNTLCYLPKPSRSSATEQKQPHAGATHDL